MADARLLIAEIEDLLPQTQCGKCGTPGCRPYAEAVAAGTPHNRCVPGGADTIAALAALLERPVLALDSEFGVEPETRRIAFIREAECIGCTKCLQACPVDAIMGAAKLMHTVLADECTGCDLCLAPCPVDCIEMHDLPKVTDAGEKGRRARHYRARFEARSARLARDSAEVAVVVPVPAAAPMTPAADDKSRVIAAALARTNLKKAERRLAEAEAAGADTSALRVEVERLRREVSTFG